MKYGLLIAGLLSTCALAVTQTQAAASQIKSNYVASNYANTKYPLVFAHGMGGWNRAGTDELGVDYSQTA